MRKKVPLYFLLSLPAVLVWIFLFPQSGTRELYLQTEWRLDRNALFMLPNEQEVDAGKLESVFMSGGIQVVSADGQRGHFLGGEIVAVRQSYKVVRKQDVFFLAYDNGVELELGTASMVFARDHLCALVSPDGHAVRVFLVDEGRSYYHASTAGISVIDVMDDTSVIIGTLDGAVLLLDAEGRLVQEFRPAGAGVPCIYGLTWLPGDRQLLVMSGLYPQRLHYLEFDAAENRFGQASSVEMPFAVRSRSLMFPVFDDRLVMFDLGTFVVLYEPAQRLFHAIKHLGNLVNAVMIKGTDILALGTNQVGRYQISLIKPDGRVVAQLERPGSLSDFVPAKDTGLLVSAPDGISRLRWSFR